MAEPDIDGAASANIRFLKCTAVFTYVTEDITQKCLLKLPH